MPIEGGRGAGYVIGTGSFSATSNGLGVQLVRRGDFNVSLWVAPANTFGGTVVVERSFDGGGTWLPFTDIDGLAISWGAGVSTILTEPQEGVYWRFRCSAFSSGPINWMIGQ